MDWWIDNCMDGTFEIIRAFDKIQAFVVVFAGVAIGFFVILLITDMFNHLTYRKTTQ